LLIHKAKKTILGGNISDGKLAFKTAFEGLSNRGKWPVNFLMNLNMGQDSYAGNLSQEIKEFEEFCRTGPAWGIDPRGADHLPVVLSEIRKLENDTDWLLQWAVEKVHVFGLPDASAAYGTTWWRSWRTLFERPTVTEALQGLSHSATSQTVTVLGSGLGEQCLFAAALGMRCIGVEALCESMVATSQRLVREQRIPQDWLQYTCGNVTEVDLSSTALLWSNDLLFPEETRRTIYERAARDLPRGAALVLYAEPLEGMAKELELIENVTVEMSWREDVVLYIFRKAGMSDKRNAEL